MDYLQYFEDNKWYYLMYISFKPYYKWITFNIKFVEDGNSDNLLSFKPYYKWITFNMKLSYML